MLEFGGENNIITAKTPNAPFLISLTDTPDNELKIVIALPARGGLGEHSEEFKDVIFDIDFVDKERDGRKHYGIYTENHIIDVISNDKPLIKRVRS